MDRELAILLENLSNNQVAFSEAFAAIGQNQKNNALFAKEMTNNMAILMADRDTVFNLRDRILKLEENEKKQKATNKALAGEILKLKKKIDKLENRNKWNDVAKQATYEDLL